MFLVTDVYRDHFRRGHKAVVAFHLYVGDEARNKHRDSEFFTRSSLSTISLTLLFDVILSNMI